MNGKLRSVIKCILILFVIVVGIGCAGFITLLWRECAKYPLPQPPIDPNRINMVQIKLALINCRATYGRFPDSLDELTKPMGKNRHILLEEESLLDSWGEPFGFEHDGDNYVIWSSGRDKQLGTADDIVMGARDSYVANWKAKHFPLVGDQGTNAVQEATHETIKDKEEAR